MCEGVWNWWGFCECQSLLRGRVTGHFPEQPLYIVLWWWITGHPDWDLDKEIMRRRVAVELRVHVEVGVAMVTWATRGGTNPNLPRLEFRCRFSAGVGPRSRRFS